MATEIRSMADEPGQSMIHDETRTLSVIRRILMAGFVAVLFLEAWLAWEFYQSLH